MGRSERTVNLFTLPRIEPGFLERSTRSLVTKPTELRRVNNYV